MIKVGIIGGSGLDDPKLLQDFSEQEVETPYGKPSSKITCGNISGIPVCILSRHGKHHEIPPTLVNYRANVYALKMLGCTHILATSAVGSLRSEIKPGNLVFPSQFIDFTKQRKSSFFDELGEVRHTPMAEPYNKKIRDLLCEVCNQFGFEYNRDKTIITIEGPRFSSKAESNMFRQIGADIINMSSCPEVILANELGIPYQTIAMSTDYDCWKENEAPVTWEMILKRMNENADKVKQLLLIAIPKIANYDSDFIKDKIRTIPNFPKQGIMFRDITTLLNDVEGMNKVIEIFCKRYSDKNIDIVCGIESRGFIIGSILAHKLGAPFVPIRKKGKLPYEVVREEYSLEYGTDSIEVHKDAIKYGQRVLIVDDLIATGGTSLAACNLVKKLGGEIVECSFVIDLPDLKGKEKIEKNGFKTFSIVKFEGE
ncbi:S-methyl-5'-thioadenosine phosphorylase [uncultured archaeon]|nr:S-methyl-5'-thioadenosine phosphorylase [uncultured archaeon]